MEAARLRPPMTARKDAEWNWHDAFIVSEGADVNFGCVPSRRSVQAKAEVAHVRQRRPYPQLVGAVRS